MTDEQWKEWEASTARYFKAQCAEWDTSDLKPTAISWRNVLTLLQERNRYREALADISMQKLTSEIEPIDGEVSGDFEHAYDTMINVAREALGDPQ